METQINQFQRHLLRYMINVKWPQKISTEDLRKKIKFEDWSKEISIRPLTWSLRFRLPRKNYNHGKN